MKILFCSFNCYKKVSGEYTNLLRAAEFVRRQLGHEVDLYLPFCERGFAGYLARMLPYVLAVRRAVRAYDRVQVFIPSLAFVWVYRIIFLGVRTAGVVVYLDGLMVEDSPAEFWRRWRTTPRFADRRIYLTRALLNGRLTGRFANPAFHYLAATAQLARQLPEQQRARLPVTVVPNDYHLWLASPPPEKKAGRKVAYFGQFLRMKGIDYALRLLAGLKRALPQVEAEMLVSFNFNAQHSLAELLALPAVAAAAAAGVAFRRAVVAPGEYLAGVDILVLPYEHLYGTNILPSVIIEAVAAETLVFTVDHPVLRGYLGEHGRYFSGREEEDVAALQRALPEAAACARRARAALAAEECRQFRCRQLTEVYSGG